MKKEPFSDYFCPSETISVFLTSPCHHLFPCSHSLSCCLCHDLDDHSRVILQPIEDDPSSDYINANYIDVSGNASNATIGSQRNQRNHTPSLVCQASIPLLRLLVIHRAILYTSSHLENASYIQNVCLFPVSVPVFFSRLYPLIHECIIVTLLQYLHAAALPHYLMS